MAVSVPMRDHAGTAGGREDELSTTDERDDGTLETARVTAAVGDDIVVVPTGSPDRPPGRPWLMGGALLAILVIAGAIAILARHSSTSTPAIQTTSPTTLSTKSIVSTKKPKPKVTKKPVPVAATTVASTVPETTPGTQHVVAPPASVAAPTTVGAPKQYGASALTWTAPSSLTIASGKTAPLSVTAHNPTDGTVTLPHPLSCTPRLDHGEICTEMVQLVGAGQSASAQYTIDAHGIAAGHYTLNIEGVLTVAVTVS